MLVSVSAQSGSSLHLQPLGIQQAGDTTKEGRARGLIFWLLRIFMIFLFKCFVQTFVSCKINYHYLWVGDILMILTQLTRLKFVNL